MGHVQASRLISAPTEDVYRFITDFNELPNWVAAYMEVQLPVPVPDIKAQTELTIGFKRFGLDTEVKVRIEEAELNRFTYRASSGVFNSWRHVQTLSAHDKKTTLLSDLVDYSLPYGIIGNVFDDLYVRRDIHHILRYRHLKIEEHFRT